MKKFIFIIPILMTNVCFAQIETQIIKVNDYVIQQNIIVDDRIVERNKLDIPTIKAMLSRYKSLLNEYDTNGMINGKHLDSKSLTSRERILDKIKETEYLLDSAKKLIKEKTDGGTSL